MNQEWKNKIVDKVISRKFAVSVAMMLIGIVMCLSRYVYDGYMLIVSGGVGYLGCEMLIDIFRIVFSSGVFSKADTDDKT